MSNRESNARLEQLELVEHWKNPVLVLLKDKTPVMDGVFEMFLTTDSLGKRIEEIEDKTPYSYCQVTVAQVLDAFFHEGCEGIKINGLAETEIYMTREDLSPIEEEVDTIVTMMAVLSEQLTKKDAVNRLNEREFYILGNMPEKFDPNEDFFEFDVKEIEQKDFVKLYMTKERAEKENDRNFEVTGYTLKELVDSFGSHYGLVIEPHEEFAVTFDISEL